VSLEEDLNIEGQVLIARVARKLLGMTDTLTLLVGFFCVDELLCFNYDSVP